MTQLERCDLQWCIRRLPKKVVEIIQKYPARVCVAGGFIRACVAGEKVNDVDMFAADAELAKLVAFELCENGRQPHQSENAFTVVVGHTCVQLIHRWVFATPEDVIPSFDFTIASAAFWFDGVWKTLCHERFYQDLAGKRLVYTSPQRNEDAGGSCLRVLKFYQRGYRIPLDSFGAVLARLIMGVKLEEITRSEPHLQELQWAKVLTGQLREVDPNVDPEHLSHLPSMAEAEEIKQGEVPV